MTRPPTRTRSRKAFPVNIVVNVSDARHSAQPEDVIVTHSLGSCVGVTMYDPVRRVGGMLHHQLPASTMDKARAQANPCMFADTGVVHLLEQIEAEGGDRRRVKVKIAGAAQILADAASFNIGKRNHTAVRKALWQLGLFMDAEEVGGKSPRTLYLRIADGEVTMKSDGQSVTL